MHIHHTSVSVKNGGVGCLKLDPRPVWTHEAPLSCPLAIRRLTCVVVPESSASKCLLGYLRIFNWFGSVKR